MKSHTRCALAGLLVSLASGAAAFDLQGHRGARGLTPENTLAGFAAALSLGVSTLELDVGISKDGVPVVVHDSRLNPELTREPDGRFLSYAGPAIRSLSVSELKRYDVGRLKPATAYAVAFPEQRAVDGATIPTLAEVFDLVRRANAPHIRFNVETKLTPTSGADVANPKIFAAAVVEAIRAAGVAERTTVQSFDWRTLAEVQRIAPEIARSCITVERFWRDNIQRQAPGPSPWTAGLSIRENGGSVPRLVKAAGCAVWSPSFQDLAADVVADARSLGLRVIPWTVNEQADMHRLIEAGVDGIITDYPNRLRTVLAARGVPLPPPVPVDWGPAGRRGD